MIRVKESLAYLSDVFHCASNAAISVTPEVLRRSKLNDPGVAAEMRRLLCQMVGLAEGFTMKEGCGDAAYSEVLNLFLSLNKNPFVMQVGSEAFVDLQSSRELLKIMCWLLFSNKKLLTLMDKEMLTACCEIKIDQLTKQDTGPGPEKSKLQQLDDINELMQLKTIFFLKLEAIKTLADAHTKKLDKVLGSLQTAASKSQSQLSKMTPARLLALVSDKKAADHLIQKQEQVQKLVDQVGHRSTVLEWIAHSVIEEKTEKGQEVSSLDYPETHRLAQECQATKLLELREIYNTVSKRFDSMSNAAEYVRKFGDFWAAQCQRMSTNPDYKKVIGTVVNRETTRLATKYKVKKEASDSNEVNTQIDLFKVLVDMKASGKQATIDTKLAKGKGEAHAAASIQKTNQEYDAFVEEVKDFLLSRGIKTIHFPS